MKKLPIIFRTLGRQVTAYFPTIPVHETRDDITCYARNEGHSSADRKCLREGKPSTEPEYRKLLKELRAIYEPEFELVIKKKDHPHFKHQCRLAQQLSQTL